MSYVNEIVAYFYSRARTGVGMRRPLFFKAVLLPCKQSVRRRGIAIAVDSLIYYNNRRSFI
jgi:hypothetical protein